MRRRRTKNPGGGSWFVLGLLAAGGVAAFVFRKQIAAKLLPPKEAETRPEDIPLMPVPANMRS